jgi:hypothetical protein
LLGCRRLLRGPRSLWLCRRLRDARLLGRARRGWRGCTLRCRLGGRHPLPHNGPVGPPEVAVLGFRVRHDLPVGDLDLLLVDLALGIYVISRLGMGTGRFPRRRPHRYY